MPTPDDVPLPVRAQVACERGPVRPRNEDAARADVELGLFVVADGVGGSPAGDVAAQTAVAAIHEALADGCDGFDDMRAAVIAAHRAIRERGREEPALSGLASTVVAAWLDVDAGTLTVGHVGDSRGYLRSNGQLRRLTEDHGVGSMLTQALGQSAAPQPDVVEVPLRGAELLLLCTDGITDVLDDAELATHTAEHDLAALGDALVEAALEAGSRDNLTLIAVDLTGTAA